MKTTVLTQKKYSISLKESSANLDKFIAEMFLMAKTLKEEKDKGMRLSQAAINPVEQTIEVVVNADMNQKNSGGAQAGQQQQQAQQPQQQKQEQNNQGQQQQQTRTMPPRPGR